VVCVCVCVSVVICVCSVYVVVLCRGGILCVVMVSMCSGMYVVCGDGKHV
jgi:hypothetical protein